MVDEVNYFKFEGMAKFEKNQDPLERNFIFHYGFCENNNFLSRGYNESSDGEPVMQNMIPNSIKN